MVAPVPGLLEELAEEGNKVAERLEEAQTTDRIHAHARLLFTNVTSVSVLQRVLGTRNLLLR